jgi:hypothetical protein
MAGLSERAKQEAINTVRKLSASRFVCDASGAVNIKGVQVHPKEEVDLIATSAVYGGVIKDSNEAASAGSVRKTIDVLREKTAELLVKK